LRTQKILFLADCNDRAADASAGGGAMHLSDETRFPHDSGPDGTLYALMVL